MTSLPRIASAVIVCATALMAESVLGQQAAPPAQDPAPVFRASADIVSVEASVRRERRPVVGLTAADFTLLDNGVRAADHRRQLREAADRPHRPPRRQRERDGIGPRRSAPFAATAAGRPRRARPAEARDVRHAHTPSRRLRRSAVGHRRGPGLDRSPAGSSAVFDSLAVALTAAVPPGRRQLVVLFSDGQDSSSISDCRLAARRREAQHADRRRGAGLGLEQAARVPASQRVQARFPDRRRSCRSDRQRHRRLRRRRHSRRQPVVDVPASPRAVSHELRPVLHAAGRRTDRATTPSRCASRTPRSRFARGADTSGGRRYSARSAVDGSIDAARIAGGHAAASAVSSTISAAPSSHAIGEPPSALSTTRWSTA